jgi:hypothetical protein
MFLFHRRPYRKLNRFSCMACIPYQTRTIRRSRFHLRCHEAWIFLPEGPVCGLRQRSPVRGRYYRRRVRQQRFGYSAIAKEIQMKTLLVMGSLLLAVAR